MTNYFNDVLDDIKVTMQAADHHYAESNKGRPDPAVGSASYPDREMERAEMFYTRTAAMNAVFQTEVLLVIADSLTRIADSLEAADDLDPPNDYRIFNRRQADGTFRPLSEFFDKHE